jgi:Integrase core domain
VSLRDRLLAAEGQDLGYPRARSSGRSASSASEVASWRVVLAEYVEHYNQHRPHRFLDQRSPSSAVDAPAPIRNVDATHLRRTDVLGGLLHEYRLVA